MRDGKMLAADILLPSRKGKFPTIFIHTPYDRQFGGGPLPHELMSHELQDREHYAYVIVDWRGRYGSKDAARGKKILSHGEDGYDVIEWIARQPWSNGKVGMWGVSAVGAVQYDIALDQPPHLVCIVPASANMGLAYEQFYYGGVLQRYYLGVFDAVGHSAGKLVRAHPTPDRTWQEIRERMDESRIDLPILFITGWYDTHPDLKIETFNKIRGRQKHHYDDMKLILGPWLHTRLGQRKQGSEEYPAAEGVTDRAAMRFFDYWLRGLKDNEWNNEPTVRYFQMGADKWHTAHDWPPETDSTTYYLRAGGGLSLQAPGEESSDSYKYDPRDPTPTVGGNLIEVPKARLKIPVGPQDLRQKVESRDDVLIYTTEVLNENVHVVGQAHAKLYVSSNRKDTDFAVRLSDVHPDGRSILVTDGIQRMRYRKSLKQAELMKPGNIYEVTVTLPSTAMTFVAGHRIRITVSSANWPRFDANSNMDRRRLIRKTMVANNRVFHDDKHLSALKLPTLNH
jgi:putative CocE/NonD family hydrolase